MTILDSNLHLKPRQTRGTEFFRFRSYLAIGVIGISSLIGLAFHFSKFGQHTPEWIKLDQNVHTDIYGLKLGAVPKHPAEMLQDFKQQTEEEKYY